jgi:hypothetical protein
MSFSLCAMIWFSIKNNMVQRECLPITIRYVLLNFFGGQSYLRAIHRNGQAREKRKFSSNCSIRTTQNTKSTKFSSKIF